MTSGGDVDQPGFGFDPTEEDLINYYLPQKINGNHSVDCVIADIDNICRYEPEELPGLAAIQSSKHEWYFFSPRNSERTKRVTEHGFWQVTGKKRTIKDRKNQDIIKRYLVFHTGRSSHRVWTNWAMHEYYLKPSSSAGGFVIYRLREKSRKTIVKSVVDQGEPSHDSSSVIENPVIDQCEPGHDSSSVIENPVADILSPEEDLQFVDEILNSDEQDFTSPAEPDPRMQISHGPSFVNLQETIGRQDNIFESQKSCPVTQDVHSYQGITHTGTAPADSSLSESLGSNRLDNISDTGVFNYSLFDFCIEAPPVDNRDWIPYWWLKPASACSSYT